MAKKKKKSAPKPPLPPEEPPAKKPDQPPETPAPETSGQEPSFPVVGMVASAGGLDAFKKFFAAMPADSGVAFVLVPHLDPTHESLMVELLARQTAMKVLEAEHQMPVCPNQVYIIPPNRYMTIKGGVLQLTGPVERGGVQTSIDLFLRSLAEDQQERAICIVLSGTGAHGTLGLKAIKSSGGMAMVQDPVTADYDRMPQNAIATGLADYVLPVEQMPEALIQFVRHAANEEVMSMNEELQSANEELETSKEELQSLNEELTTVNNQLQSKVEELESANNDMTNLLNCTDIATLFLDTDFRIKRFTAATSRLLNLIAGDVGRPIGDIALKFQDEHLMSDALKVLRNPAMLDREVQAEDGRWYLRRISPYRTAEHRNEGVVITFVDISASKKTETELRRMSAVFMEGGDPIFIEDLKGCLLDLNKETERVYGWAPAELLGQSALVLVAPSARQAKEELLQQCRRGQPVRYAESRHVTRTGSEFPVLVTLTLLTNDRDNPSSIATLVKPITELKRSEREQQQLNKELERRVAERTAQLEASTRRLEHEMAERKALELQILDIVDTEHRRLGQDLHDEVGQELTSLRLLVEDLMENHPKSEQTIKLAKITDGLKRSLHLVGQLARGLVPVELDPQGLMAALRDFAARTSNGICCRFHCEAEVLVKDNTTASQLYHIALEAVTNALKHGHAKNVDIDLAQKEGLITLTIRDDGIGIQEGAREKPGMGLKTMRYRADLINARFDVQAGKERGTVVTCLIPG